MITEPVNTYIPYFIRKTNIWTIMKKAHFIILKKLMDFVPKNFIANV